MATFYKQSRLWVIDFTYDGRPRRWYKALPDHADGPATLAATLADLHGARARIVEVRPATAQEEVEYVRGTLPRNQFCPTLAAPPAPPARRG